MVNEDGDGWDLPGGGWEHAETIEQALAREVSEELGVALQACSGPLAVLSLFVPRHQRHGAYIIYRATLQSEDFVITAPVTEIAYVPVATLSVEQLDHHLRPVADTFIPLLQRLCNVTIS